MLEPKEEEQALKVFSSGRGNGRGSGRGGFRGGRGRGRQSKETVECYKCHKLGHFQYECPNIGENANYAGFNEEEEVLLMALVEANYENDAGEVIWFLDSGCSNHICGTKDWFVNLDEDYRVSVRLGDHSRVKVMGKGTVKMQICGRTQIFSDVYWIPELKSNLLSIGQIQEKGLAILFKENQSKIYHDEKGLLMSSSF